MHHQKELQTAWIPSSCRQKSTTRFRLGIPHHPLSVLLLICAVAAECCCGGDIECQPEQRSLLLEIKKKFSVPDYTARNPLASWIDNSTSNCCRWDGITCDGESGQITGLDLSGLSISGNLSSSLFELTSLRSLDLSFNRFFQVQIPQSGFEKLTQLRRLNLSGAGFAGQVPLGISRLENLISLDLSGSYLRIQNPDLGTLVGNLSSLRELALDGVDISYDAEWSRAFSTLPQLQVLRLSRSGLQGTLPKDFFHMKNLTMLDLSENLMLSGELPDFPEDSALQVLELSYTYISGKLPDSIGNLKFLTSLNKISRDLTTGLTFAETLTGDLPSSIGNLTQLVTLDLSSNRFSGNIPLSIKNLIRLVYLDLSGNHLEGPIPVFLFSLPRLEQVLLNDNQLSGRLLDFVNTSTSLQFIYLGNNQLQGQIPQSFFKLPALKLIMLELNNFSGTVELDIFQSLKNLSILDLSNNKWSVRDVSDNYLKSFPQLGYVMLSSSNLTKIPTFLKHQNAVVGLDLSNNQIVGDIPKWIWTIGGDNYFDSLNLSRNFFTSLEGVVDLTQTSLTVLDLHSNMLQGPIPLPPSNVQILDYSQNNFSDVILSNISSYCSDARYISFASNNLNGEIPRSICEISELHILDLSYNNLNGSIPPCLLAGDNRLLVTVNLKGNQIQGTIPRNVSKICKLRTLILNSNHLEGRLPKSLGRCSDLELLDIGNNYLVDSFPSWMGNLTNLRILILRGNEIYGPIEFPENYEGNTSFSNLQILDLSSNHMNGNLSSKLFSSLKEMGNSSQSGSSTMGISFLDDYFYKDEVSITTKGEEFTLKKVLTIYTTIDFSNNRFEGDIPDTIGELQGLHCLNLSNNALTGEVPLAIGNLKQLESLDLSANHLSGKIPQELASLTFLAYLNLSNNRLVGKIPEGNQWSTFPNASFRGNPELCGIPLTKLCGNKSATETYTNSADSKDSTYVIGMALSTGLGFGVGIAISVALQNKPPKFWRRPTSHQT